MTVNKNQVATSQVTFNSGFRLHTNNSHLNQNSNQVKVLDYHRNTEQDQNQTKIKGIELTVVFMV